MSRSNQILKQDILIRLKNGDESALSLLYDLYWEQLFIAAYNLVRNKEVCEDILQDLFINIWNKRETLQINSSIKSYLYSATIYKTYDYFRKNKKMHTVELFEEFDKRIYSATPESKLIHKELVEFIDSSIETLPGKCKEVFKLSREDQLTHKEIAEKLNISTKTVEAHITKALKLLKISLNGAVSVELLLFLLNLMLE